MSSFWGAEVKPGKPYTHTHSVRRGRLRLTQATLGSEVGNGEKSGRGKKCVLQCSVKSKEPVFICTLVSEQSETCHLELEFEEKYVTFSVLGPRSVHLAGYFLGDVCGEDIGASDTGSDSLESDDGGFLYTDDDDDDNTMIIPVSPRDISTDSEDDYSDSDDSEMIPAYRKHRGKSSVVIEEIQEDDKPAGGQKGSNKKQTSEDGGNSQVFVEEIQEDDKPAAGGQKGSNKKQASKDGGNSQGQLVVRTPPAESLESEDEDGFPVSFSESKKSAESGSKKNRNLNNERSNVDRKRKSNDISDRPDSSREVRVENDGMSKKKKKSKDKRTAVDSEKVNSEEEESKQQEFPADQVDASVDAKQKNKKNKNVSASEADTDQQADKKNHIHNNAEEVTAQEAKKKKKNKKKKTQEKNTSENQSPIDLIESESKKQPLQTRTFGNGLIIQEVAMGKPDGKKASPGRKVSVNYIGSVKNGTIFDSTIGRRPFEFRLGVGQVIKGWDIGINGMRVGDKRRLTIPPSMGYGDQRMGKIPQNSTLVFDVELVNVK